jgi:myosin-1
VCSKAWFSLSSRLALCSTSKSPSARQTSRSLTPLSPDLGIYTEDVLSKYKGKNRLEVPPHVFGIAESAYYNMNAYHENQCVIISGESGAGKTEAAKRIMQYIAAVSGGKDSSIQEIKDMVLATNPLLESFGCAKTLRNNNSSRHVRFFFSSRAYVL